MWIWAIWVYMGDPTLSGDAFKSYHALFVAQHWDSFVVSSDTRAKCCYLDVVWYDLNATPEMAGRPPISEPRYRFYLIPIASSFNTAKLGPLANTLLYGFLFFWMLLGSFIAPTYLSAQWSFNSHTNTTCSKWIA